MFSKTPHLFLVLCSGILTKQYQYKNIINVTLRINFESLSYVQKSRNLLFYQIMPTPYNVLPPFWSLTFIYQPSL